MTATMYQKRAIISAAALILVVLFCAVLTGWFNHPPVSPVKALTAAVVDDGEETPAATHDIHYHAYDAENPYFFGTNAYTESSGDVAQIFCIDANGNVVGILPTRMKRDPALAGAVITHVLKATKADWVAILGDRAAEFQTVPSNCLANDLHKAFLEDYAFWDQAVDNTLNYLKSSCCWVQGISGYTSSMYMIKDGLDGNKPLVVVRKSTNTGGHAIVFDLGAAGRIMFRLECGFQPINPHEYWSPSPTTTTTRRTTRATTRRTTRTTTRTTTNTTRPSTTSTTTSTTKTTTQPTTEPTKPSTTLKPKNPDAGPQAQSGGTNPDYGGPNSQNENPDTAVTPEPTSPETYTPPTRPTTTTTHAAPTQSTSGSGSETVDRDNGKTVTATNGKTYEVVAGDNKPRENLDTVQSTASAANVETPVQNDGVNTGDIVAPE